MRDGRIHTPADVDAAVVEGAAARVRPLIMTVATTANPVTQYPSE